MNAALEQAVPDWVASPIRRDPVTGQTFRFDETCRGYAAVFWIRDGVEESIRTAVSIAMLRRSVPEAIVDAGAFE